MTADRLTPERLAEIRARLTRIDAAPSYTREYVEADGAFHFMAESDARALLRELDLLRADATAALDAAARGEGEAGLRAERLPEDGNYDFPLITGGNCDALAYDVETNGRVTGVEPVPLAAFLRHAARVLYRYDDLLNEAKAMRATLADAERERDLLAETARRLTGERDAARGALGRLYAECLSAGFGDATDFGWPAAMRHAHDALKVTP